MAETAKIRKRSEIPVEDTWAIEDLFVNDEAWEQALAALLPEKDALAAYAGHLADSAETLCAYLTKMEQVNSQGSLLANYCMRRSDVDTRNATYQAMVGKFMGAIFLDIGCQIHPRQHDFPKPIFYGAPCVG